MTNTSQHPQNGAQTGQETLNEYTQVVIPFQGFYHSIHAEATDFTEYAQAYAKQWAHEVHPKHNRALDLEFCEVISPHEYNFTTDKILCTLPAKDINYIFNYMTDSRAHVSILSAICKLHLTPKSGFMPFYSYDWRTWGPVLSWKPMQLMLLLQAFQSLFEAEDGAMEAGIADMLCGNGYTTQEGYPDDDDDGMEDLADEETLDLEDQLNNLLQQA